MLTSITLKNFKSFGAPVTVPLEPITVLVGPNNSGKSNFMSVGRFVQNAVLQGHVAAMAAENGPHFLFHRPADTDARLQIGWETTGGFFNGAYKLDRDQLVRHSETLQYMEGDRSTDSPWQQQDNFVRVMNQTDVPKEPFAAMKALRGLRPDDPVCSPAVNSRLVKLSVSALKQDSRVEEHPRLQPNGAGLASVLGLWRGADPEIAEELEEFIRRCVPEIKHVLVKPSSTPGTQRIWYRQDDGETFDAEHASEGLLMFTALTANIVTVGRDFVIFIEEPEQGIHPRRLSDLIDLMRTAVSKKSCQFILATHSPVVLDNFRNDPEAINLFRRGEHGTEVKRCTDLPRVAEALENSTPGELLETAFFDTLWPDET